MNTSKTKLPGVGADPGHRYPPFFWSWMALAVLATFILYLPVLNHRFVNLDDPVYILKNPLIRNLSLSSIGLMLRDFSQSGFWLPMTWLSLGVDYHFAGFSPAPYLMHNLLLHCANTALAYLVSYRVVSWAYKSNLRGEGKPAVQRMAIALFTASLFSLHPLHVESVAWATERKDVLYGLYFLLSVLMYLSHSERPRYWKYGASLVFFILSIAAKPMAITLPLVLILLDSLRNGPSAAFSPRGLLNKAPFLAVSALLASATLAFYYANPNLVFDTPRMFRFMNAAHSLILYLVKMVWPSDLRPFIPADLNRTFSLGYILAALGVVGLAIHALRSWKTRPAIAVAWAFYLLTLAPVLGFVQSGIQSSADRFTYLPSLGPTLLFSAFFMDRFYKRRWLGPLLAVGILSGLVYTTHRQIATWKDPVTLWENVLRIQPRNSSFAYAAMAEAYKDDGRWDEAKTRIEMALEQNPRSPGYTALRGEILLKMGLVDDAIRDLQAALVLNSSVSSEGTGFHPRLQLASAYNQKGMFLEALAEAKEAVRLKPLEPAAYQVLGLACAGLKQYSRAIEAYQKALLLEPDRYHPETLRYLRIACMDSVETKGKYYKTGYFKR